MDSLRFLSVVYACVSFKTVFLLAVLIISCLQILCAFILILTAIIFGRL